MIKPKITPNNPKKEQIEKILKSISLFFIEKIIETKAIEIKKNKLHACAHNWCIFSNRIKYINKKKPPPRPKDAAIPEIKPNKILIIILIITLY